MKWYGIIACIMLGFIFIRYIVFLQIFAFPVAMAEDPLFGLGQLTGLIATTWFSIWLVKRSLKKGNHRGVLDG